MVGVTVKLQHRFQSFVKHPSRLGTIQCADFLDQLMNAPVAWDGIVGAITATPFVLFQHNVCS